ncbi:MAG: AAA family ATPase [Candidatus Omnitrophica bacterium]|nr:AAA family ATPase [Candidatus Omnitrophota bacterium]
MPEYELNLRDYLRIFHKRKFLIVTTFLVITIGNIFYLSMQPSVYKASTTVKILERQSIAGLLTEWIVYSPADIMESQAKIINGYPIMKRVALRLSLIDDSTPIQEVYNVVANLQSRITAETIERTNIIEITASAGNAKEAMNLANAVAHLYVEENLSEKKKQAGAARQFIEEQLSQLEVRLREGEAHLRGLDEGAKNVKLAEPIQKKLIDLEFELTSLLQKYTDKHPYVMRLNEQIKNLEEHLKGFSGQELEYARFIREGEVNKKLYGILKEKLEEARITEARKIGDVSIVDPAFMPRSPVSPQKELGALIGGVVALVLGIFLAFLSESLDASIGTIEDVEKEVKLPVLGIIPSVSRELKKEEKIFTKFMRKISPLTKKDDNEEIYVRLIVHHEPKSPVADAYRNIRTNLRLNPSQKTILVTSAAPREGKTTTLTNLGLAIAQKGIKTLLVSSDLRRPVLAKSFGMQKEPGLNEVVSGAVTLEDAIRGISDIMLGDMGFEEIMKSPGIENIYILPSGYIPSNPAEILESAEFAKIVEELKKKFDVIIFDSPPVLPVTDASLLASKVDSVVLCYEIGRTARAALVRAKTQLESVGAKISGVVLNHITPQTEAMAPYPYYYRYKYRYDTEEKKAGKKLKTGKGKESPQEDRV